MMLWMLIQHSGCAIDGLRCSYRQMSLSIIQCWETPTEPVKTNSTAGLHSVLASILTVIICPNKIPLSAHILSMRYRVPPFHVKQQISTLRACVFVCFSTGLWCVSVMLKPGLYHKAWASVQWKQPHACWCIEIDYWLRAPYIILVNHPFIESLIMVTWNHSYTAWLLCLF